MSTERAVEQGREGPGWRALQGGDLPALTVIAGLVHPSHPEDQAVFAERLALYPKGCFVLSERGDALGYVLSHPWHLDRPPRLDTFLERIPERPTTFYIHDLALLPAARGAGAGSAILTLLRQHACERGLPNLSLVAVNNSVAFWTRHGFRVRARSPASAKLASYGAEARYMWREVAP